MKKITLILFYSKQFFILLYCNKIIYMLQRRQTIYLLVSAIVICLGYFIPFAHNTHVSIVPSVNIITQEYIASYTIFTTIATIAIAATSLVCIFLFKNRSIQKLVCIIIALLCIGLVAYEFFIGNDKAYHSTLYFGFCLPILSFIFTCMAWYGVHKDHMLVKSADRLR